MKKIILMILTIISININAQFYIENVVTATIENGANAYIEGSVIIQNGGVLNNEGSLFIIKYGGIDANFTDSTIAPYFYGNGTTIFTGTGTQDVSTVNTFGKVQVEDAGLNLLTDVNSNFWYLKSGIVNTGQFYAIAHSTSQSAVQNDAANPNYSISWFNHSLRRYLTTNNTDSYLYPVGAALHTNMAELVNLSTDQMDLEFISVSFNQKQGTDVGLNVSENGTIYTSVNDVGVWDITPNILPVTGKYDLKLYFDGFVGLSDNKFGILERYVGSINAADWVVPFSSVLPASSNPGRLVLDGFAKRNSMSTFGQMGIGMTTVPLPLNLLSFTGVKKNKDVLLQWVTANEVNVSHFDIYRNDNYWETVESTEFQNNTYTKIDYIPLKGLNNYKLKMVDKNNDFKWSNTVSINFEEQTKVSVYPNPVTTVFNISGIDAKEVRLIASDGREVLQIYNSNKVVLPANLSKGNYVVQINNGNEILNFKINKP